MSDLLTNTAIGVLLAWLCLAGASALLYGLWYLMEAIRRKMKK